MTDDPIVSEVRETRRRIFEECNNDLHQLIERLKSAEIVDKSRIVTLDDVQKLANISKGAP
jgi:hypothetical protein